MPLDMSDKRLFEVHAGMLIQHVRESAAFRRSFRDSSKLCQVKV